MAYDLSMGNVLRLSAGIGILLIGVFVLLARHSSKPHRAFFAFALVDGVSTGLLALRDIVDDPGLQIYFMGVYYYFFLVFVAMVFGFGLLYPRPIGGPRGQRVILATLATLTSIALLLYALRHDWFYDVRQTATGLTFPRASGGAFVSFGFIVGVTVAVTKLARDVLAAPTAVMREQSAFMLGGMVVGYGTVFGGLTIEHLQTMSRTFGHPDPLLRALVWAYLIGAAATVVFAVALYRTRAAMEPHVRRFLAGAFLASFVLTPIGILEGEGGLIAARLGLLVYPIFLGIAIVRAEAFSINPQLRRATVLTLIGASIATTFVLLENFLQGFLADSLLSGLGSDLVVSILSALLAAGVIIPLLGLARRIATRFLPVDAEHVRALATYRLVLEGALQDGLLDARESRTLDALREALSVSEREHHDILRAVRASRERETSAPAPGSVDHSDGVEAGPSF